jgi:uncharacterized protein (DUF433 family)
MSKEYIEEVEGMYRITGSRVSLDSIVYAYWKGQTAESIGQSFPTLSLEQVYGAITYYLANRATIDAYLEQHRKEYEAKRQASRDQDPMFYKKWTEHCEPQRASSRSMLGWRWRTIQ